MPKTSRRQQRQWQWSSKLRYRQLDLPRRSKGRKVSTVVRPQPQSPLFQLPPELRNMIYAKIFEDVTMLSLQCPFEEDKVPSGIILACKQCYIECKEHYFKSSTFRYESIEWAGDMLEDEPSEQVDRYRFIEVECTDINFNGLEVSEDQESAYYLVERKAYDLLDESDRRILEERRGQLVECFQRELDKRHVKLNSRCKVKMALMDWDE